MVGWTYYLSGMAKGDNVGVSCRSRIGSYCFQRGMSPLIHVVDTQALVQYQATKMRIKEEIEAIKKMEWVRKM